MSEPGYVDYARMTLANGFLLGRGTQVFNVATNLFFGYVGSWPYLNIFMNITGGGTFYVLQLNYYSDKTFTHLVAQTQIIRSDTTVSVAQYAPLSPWVSIYMIPITVTSPGTAEWAVYGSTGKSSAAQLAALSVNGIEQSNTVANGSGSTYTGIVQVPGPWTVTWRSTVVPCFFELLRYDFNTAAFQVFWKTGSVVANESYSATVVFPDAPWQLSQNNRGGAAGELDTYAYPLMY